MRTACCLQARALRRPLCRGPPASPTRSTEEAAIRELLNTRARALHDKDAEQVLGYTPDIVNFDLAPPLAQRGREATEPAFLQSWFGTWKGPIGIIFDPAQVAPAESSTSRSASST